MRLADMYQDIVDKKLDMEQVLSQSTLHRYEALDVLLEKISRNEKNERETVRFLLYYKQIGFFGTTEFSTKHKPEEVPGKINVHLREYIRLLFRTENPFYRELLKLYDVLNCPLEKVPEYISYFPTVAGWRLENA